MEDLSLHILDVAENAVRAGATEVVIELHESRDGEVLELKIRDDGKGMDEHTLKRATDPFFTTREASRVGLGLPLLSQAAQEAGGQLRVTSSAGCGTEVVATFQCRHPDMRPAGDVFGTLAALVAGHPSVRFVLDSDTGGERVHFDSHAGRPASDDNTSGLNAPGISGEEE